MTNCFHLDIDEIEEYASCVVAEEKMKHTMELYKREMFAAKSSRDRGSYEKVRQNADILAKSIEHVQKSKEKWEMDVIAAFEQGRPQEVDDYPVDADVDMTSDSFSDDS